MRVKAEISASAEVIDFFDYAPRLEPRGQAPVRTRSRRAAVSPWDFDISDDWPDRVPITEAELDLFEVHFGPILDELLGSKN